MFAFAPIVLTQQVQKGGGERHALFLVFQPLAKAELCIGSSGFNVVTREARVRWPCHSVGRLGQDSLISLSEKTVIVDATFVTRHSNIRRLMQ